MSELYLPHPWQALVGIVTFTPIQWGVATLFHHAFTPGLFLSVLVPYLLIFPVFYVRRRSPRMPHPWRRGVVANFFHEFNSARQWAGGYWGLVRREEDVYTTVQPASRSVLRWEPVDEQFQGTTENWG